MALVVCLDLEILVVFASCPETILSEKNLSIESD